MFEVLMYVYENYWRGDACPELNLLQKKLSAVGFEADEIHQALNWLDGLNLAACETRSTVTPESTPSPDPTATLPSRHSMRVFSVAEQDQLGAECLGFIAFLSHAGVLPDAMREIIMDRAMAVAAEPLSLDDLKVIILMVYWSFDREPDALVLDELCEDQSHRLAH